MAGVQCMVFAINLFMLYDDIQVLIVPSLVQSSPVLLAAAVP